MPGGQATRLWSSEGPEFFKSTFAVASIACSILGGVAVLCAAYIFASWITVSLGVWVDIEPDYSGAHMLVYLALAALFSILALWFANRADMVLAKKYVAGGLQFALESNEPPAELAQDIVKTVFLSLDKGVDITRSVAVATYGITIVLAANAISCVYLPGTWSVPILLLTLACLTVQLRFFVLQRRKPATNERARLDARIRFFWLWRLREWPRMMDDTREVDASSDLKPVNYDTITVLPALSVFFLAVLQVTTHWPSESLEMFVDVATTTLVACLLGFGLVAFGQALADITRSPLRRLVINSPLPKTRDRMPAQPDFDGSVNLSDAVLMHPSRKKPVLNEVNLRVEAGTITGVTGSVGSGKTALIKVLLGQVRLDKGTVMFGTFNGQTLANETNQGCVTGLLQGDRPMGLTLMNNIRLSGARNAKEAFDLAAVTGAGIEPNVLPQGLSTMAGDRGAYLSTSEQQRLNLACVLSSNAKILAIDDVISTLGAGRISKVFDFVRENDRTLIIVSSDPEVLARTDIVYRLEDGDLTEIEK